jgi:hypothetical protein
MEKLQKFMQMLKDSAIMRQQFAAAIVAILSLLGTQVDFDVDAALQQGIDGVLLILSLVLSFWTMFTRATKPAPNLTETANRKEVELVQKGEIPKELASHGTVAAVKKQGGFVRLSVLGLFVTGFALALGLTGCPSTVNPMAKAETVEQKVYAGYGTVVIFAERGAELLSDDSLSQEVRTGIAKAIKAAQPVANKAADAVLKAEAIRAEVAAGASTEEDLLIAVTNLNKYYLELEPLIADLVKAVTAAFRCGKLTGEERLACEGGAA